MSARSISLNGQPPAATIDFQPAVADNGKGLIYDSNSGAYVPGTPIIGEVLTPPTLTLAGNGTTTNAVNVTTSVVFLPGGLRLVTLQFPPTVTAIATAAAAASFTGTISAIDLAPVTTLRTAASIWDPDAATQVTPATLEITDAGVFTLKSSANLTNKVQTIGFTVTYLGKAAP